MRRDREISSDDGFLERESIIGSYKTGQIEIRIKPTRRPFRHSLKEPKTIFLAPESLPASHMNDILRST
jgi:hypothetical protein